MTIAPSSPVSSSANSGVFSASSFSRFLLVALPAATFVLALFYYKKKKNQAKADKGRDNLVQEDDKSNLPAPSDKEDGLLVEREEEEVVEEITSSGVASSKTESNADLSWAEIVDLADEKERQEDKNIEQGLTNLRLNPEDEQQSRPNTADSVATNNNDNGLGGSLCEDGGEESSSSNSVACGSDSGRGSEADDVTGGAATASTTTATATILAYHFNIPSYICGKLIGARGANINQLKSVSKCRVILKELNYENKKNNRRKYYKDESSEEYQLCIIEGTRTGIEKCLELIRERFPLNEFPDLSLDQVNTPNNNMSPALQLASGVMNEVQVSTIVSPSHLFLQQPSHPTFPALDRLNACMYRCYTELATPELQRDAIDVGVVCVALFENMWYRVQIVAYESTSNNCGVKFLDYGGYVGISASDLRQIRSDFLSLPFQAIECYLANITPPVGDVWSVESAMVLGEILNNKIGTASWIGVAEDGIPMVHLFVNDSKNPEVTINVNRELVDKEAAAWIEHSPVEEAVSPSSS